MGSLADVGMPELFAAEAVGKNARTAEEDVDRLAVGHGRGRSVAVQGDEALEVFLGRLGLFRLGPEDMSAGPVQADDMVEQVLDFARFVLPLGVAAVAGQEDFVAQRDGAGRTGAGQPRLPGHVLFDAPMSRKPLLVGDPRGVEAAEPRPIGPGQKGDRQDHREQNRDPARQWISGIAGTGLDATHYMSSVGHVDYLLQKGWKMGMVQKWASAVEDAKRNRLRKLQAAPGTMLSWSVCRPQMSAHGVCRLLWNLPGHFFAGPKDFALRFGRRSPRRPYPAVLIKCRFPLRNAAAMARGISASASTTWARFRATWAFISCSRAVASARRSSAFARATRMSASA